LTSSYANYTYTQYGNWNGGLWKRDDINNLILGYDHDGTTNNIRVTQQYVDVYARKQGNPFAFAGEIIEMVSTDGGTNWTTYWRTNNSTYGCPIVTINRKYQDEVQLVYSRGNDVVYYTDKTLGDTVRTDGDDVRIVYSQNEATNEIHRLATMWNLDNTILNFKAQNQILANAERDTLGLYWCYHGKASADNTPLRHSEEIFVRNEGFETNAGYTTTTSLNKFNGWASSSGITIPGAYALGNLSVIYDGDNEMRIASTGAQACTLSVGTDITSYEIVAYLQYGVSVGADRNRVYFGIAEGDSTFKIGVDDSTDLAVWWDGSWHNTGYDVAGGAYYKVKIVIDASGVDAWFEDTLLCTNNTTWNASGGFDKLIAGRIAGSTELYLDHIRVYRWLSNPPEVSLNLANIKRKVGNIAQEDKRIKSILEGGIAR
jgi:hypothetical protein